MNHDDLLYNLIFVIIVLLIRIIHGTPFKFPKLEHEQRIPQIRACKSRSVLHSLGWSLPTGSYAWSSSRLHRRRRSASAVLAGPRPPVRAAGAGLESATQQQQDAAARRRPGWPRAPGAGPARACAGAASWRGSRPREGRAGWPVGS